MVSVGAMSPDVGDRSFRESQGKMMCSEMQRECSGRATLPRDGVVGAPLNSRLRAGLRSVKRVTGPRLSRCREPKQLRKQAAAAATL